VLGATVLQILAMLSGQILLLVFASIVIATPVAWYFANKWLQDYAYRININLWVFVLAGFTALMIAFITVSYQAIKAALANPVTSLRTD
jgi:putative ABC transport system permease protein